MVIIVVSGNEEHPDGFGSPDGKKRAWMRMQLEHIENVGFVESDAKKCEKEGTPYKVEGNYLFYVRYETNKGVDGEKSQQFMKKLWGE